MSDFHFQNFKLLSFKKIACIVDEMFIVRQKIILTKEKHQTIDLFSFNNARHLPVLHFAE